MTKEELVNVQGGFSYFDIGISLKLLAESMKNAIFAQNLAALGK